MPIVGTRMVEASPAASAPPRGGYYTGVLDCAPPMSTTPLGRKPTPPAGPGVEPRWVTTANGFDGHRIVEYRGVVRGIVVRSRSVLGNIGASVQTFFGGNIALYTDLCERARQDAYGLMLRHAAEAGANAVVAMRYDANEVAPGVTEVLAYGTAVVLETAPRA